MAARSSRATAWKGTWLVCDSQKAVNTSTPRRPATADTSRTRRLLPMPGDPATPTTAPWPSMARSNMALNGGQSPTADQPAPTRHAREGDAVPPCPQPLGRDRLIGTLNAHHLRLAQGRCAVNQSCGGCAQHHPARRAPTPSAGPSPSAHRSRYNPATPTRSHRRLPRRN